MIPLSEIQEYVKDKNVLLVGNNQSLPNTDKSKLIDSYDIVVRMNHAEPQPNIGKKTDILFTSTKLSNKEILQFHSRYLIWMTKSIKRLPEHLRSCTIHNPPEDWQELKDLYPNKQLPSTGCIVINFLLKHIEFKSLTIYGFDNFLKSGTWYHGIKNQAWHNGKFEKELMENWFKNKSNIYWIKE